MSTRLTVLLFVCWQLLANLAYSQNAAAQPSRSNNIVRPTIQGYVRDEEGRGLKDVSVWMLLRGGVSSENVLSFEQTQTDTAGSFAFELKEAGNVTLAATAPTTSWAVQHLFEVQPSNVKVDNVLVLTRPRKIQLRIEDQKGQRIAGVNVETISWEVAAEKRVWLLPELAKRTGLGLPVSVHGNTVTVDKLPSYAADLSIGIAHPNYALAQTKITEQSTTDKTVVLKSGYPLELKVRKSSSGDPISNQKVTVHYYDDANSQDLVFRFVKVDENGNATIFVPSAKHLQIRVDHTLYKAREWHSFHKWPRDGSGAEVTIELSPVAKVRGRVLDGETQVPAANVHVGLMVKEGQYIDSTRTNAEGIYEMTGPEGPAQISITSGGGYFSDELTYVQAQLKGGEVAWAERELIARRLPPLTGIVVENGVPVENAVIYTRNSYGVPAVSDAQGRFSLPLEDDVFERVVDFQHVANNSSATLVVLRHPVEKNIRIELQESAEIRGRIANWKPAEDTKKVVNLYRHVEATNSPMPSSGVTSLWQQSRINEKGEFAFRGLNRAHRYEVKMGAGDSNHPAFALTKLNRSLVELPPIGNVAEADLPYSDARTADEVNELLDFESSAWHNSAPLSLPKLKGRLVLVVFFDVAQPDCASELRWWNWMHDQYAPHGVVIVGVQKSSASFEELIEFANKNNAKFPMALDNAQGTTAQKFEVSSYPAHRLFDPEGRQFFETESPIDLWSIIQRHLEHATATLAEGR